MNCKMLTQYLSDDSIVLEAGCYNGDDTIALSQVFKNGHIYGFEPVTNIFQCLQKKVENYGNISVYQLALDNVTGKKEMYVSSGMSDQSSSLLEPKEHLTVCPEVLFDSKELVNTITINDFVKQNNIPKIDFMWLDLQGNEYNVLLESYNILPTVKLIFMEYSDIEYYKGLCLRNDFIIYLENLGFKQIYNEHVAAYKMGNMLFMKR